MMRGLVNTKDSLLLGVWREVSQHLQIEESVQRIAAAMSAVLPIELVLIRAIQVNHRCVETIAVGKCGETEPPKEARTTFREDEFETLLAWCRKGELFHRPRGRPEADVARFAPSELGGEIIAGPLGSHPAAVGILILVCRKSATFTPEHISIAGKLLQPIAAAMENDRRLQEITRLREAAEADKRSLLARLGRQDISDTIVGMESGLRPVMERVGQVTPTDVPVLIFGETGSGKEVIARAIHARSRRSKGPFHRVNCGAIPSELIDSELFGHERGSFTGAVGTRRGWFERADGGTLFLDEIGELPLAAQVRLLRILQDGSFERVGGQRQLKVDVRIVAATHRDLQAMIADGRFRQDLWYRLAVFPIYLPPLREREQDIPALATHFALRASARFGTPALVPSPEDIDLLIAYPWPGNARELASVMERAAILGDGRRLEVAKALGVGQAPQAPKSLRPEPALAPAASAEALLSLDAAMARHVEAALARTHGRVDGPDGAAKLLRINPHTLRARMRKLGVNWAQFRRRTHDA
jgi:hydrogenase-4 transcriptional activator